MTHTYKVTGMTCGGCQSKIQSLLAKVPGVEDVNINLVKGEATISMAYHVPTSEFKKAVADFPKYELSDQLEIVPPPKREPNPAGTVSWVATYKPVLLIFAYITGVSLVAEWVQGAFSLTRWMNHFMGGFFLVFSFFKLLNLRGFVESYGMYDVIARRWPAWGYLYAFLELALALAFLTGYNPIVTNTVTLVVMSVSIIGVAQSVLSKRKIKCACLGDVFNLPMSTITLIEDGLMIAMSAVMLWLMEYPI